MAINNFNVGVGTTSQLTRYRYVATGGETSISGADADSKTLSYTVGLEQVFLNGVSLVRGQDYVATNGTTISSLTALVAGDSVEVLAFVPFNIANAVLASTVDAKGDLLVGTAADTVGRLAVSATNGQALVADSSTASGLAWQTPGLVHINTTTFSGVASQTIPVGSFSADYTNYKMIINITGTTADNTIYLKMRTNTTDDSIAGYNWGYARSNTSSSTSGNGGNNQTTGWFIFQTDFNGNNDHFYSASLDVIEPFLATKTKILINTINIANDGTIFGSAGGAFVNNIISHNCANLIASAGNISGSIQVFGYNK